ncbi:nuclear transport factor 2 family protein [Shimia sp. SDUM112013]|uniref:nuclear transport factor 2 family protein n=1 Tax=Shimia sp. SDUM112013 TaxID=3136160 RepID=UPI0032F079FE
MTEIPTLDTILALEETVWKALVAGDPQADGALLTPDFLGVYPSGFSDRAGHMAELEHGPTMQDYRIEQARLVPLAAGLVLLAYRAKYLSVGNADWQSMYISSIWRQTPDGWRNSFSQDTPAA